MHRRNSIKTEQPRLYNTLNNQSPFFKLEWCSRLEFFNQAECNVLTAIYINFSHKDPYECVQKGKTFEKIIHCNTGLILNLDYEVITNFLQVIQFSQIFPPFFENSIHCWKTLYEAHSSYNFPFHISLYENANCIGRVTC
jgi:hypothetical protein